MAVHPAGFVLVFILGVVAMTLHSVPEGYIGVYFRGGRLLDSMSDPGFHLKIPGLDMLAEVQVSVQTDKVVNIPCGTSGGVIVSFDVIEVVNRLSKDRALSTVRKYGLEYDKIWIFDKIHHEINQFCSSHTLREVYIDKFDSLDESLAEKLQADCDKWETGVEIISVRVTKPRLPSQITSNFIDSELEKTKLLVATEHQKVVEKNAETDRLLASVVAQKEADVSKVTMEMDVLEQKAEQEMQLIKDTMLLARQRAESDASFYDKTRRAEANTLKFTPEYVEWQLFAKLRDTPKLVFERDLASIITPPTPAAAAEQIQSGQN